MTKFHLFATFFIFTTLLSGCISTRPVYDTNAYLTISGVIDGSEKFIFTPERVSWIHLHWSEPDDMSFDGKIWANLNRSPQKWSEFSDLDLSHAHIVKRQGRDVVALETTKDGFILYLSDSPNGAAQYSVVIAIPQKKK